MTTEQITSCQIDNTFLAIDRAHKMGGEVWGHSDTTILVWLSDEERAYLYEIGDSRFHHTPGRPLISMHCCDASQDEFQTACERLIS